MVGAWPATWRPRVLGDWLLRASRGFTQRANSVVTAGSPGMPLRRPRRGRALVRRRDLPANLTLAGPVGFDPASDPLGAEALRRGYERRVPTLARPPRPGSWRAPRARRAALLGRRAPSSVEVGGEPHPRRGSRRTAPTGRSTTRPPGDPHRLPEQVSRHGPRLGGTVVGVGRLGLASTWGGIAAMWVDPRARREGLGGRISRPGRRGGRARRVVLHLQTDSDNTAALGLYERRGFERHHEYVNLSRPSPRVDEPRLVGGRRRRASTSSAGRSASAGATASAPTPWPASARSARGGRPGAPCAPRGRRRCTRRR